MNPVFTLQYGEFSVANELQSKIKNCSVFIPASAQEKGIELLLYRNEDGLNRCVTIQVKMSRTYNYGNKDFANTLWFNRFEPQSNADWFVLTGLHTAFPQNDNVKIADAQWNSMFLAFSYNEMVEFMESVRCKKDTSKPDKMFGFGFNNAEEVYQTRGYTEVRDMSKFLLKNRITEIENTF